MKLPLFLFLFLFLKKFCTEKHRVFLKWFVLIEIHRDISLCWYLSFRRSRNLLQSRPTFEQSENNCPCSWSWFFPNVDWRNLKNLIWTFKRYPFRLKKTYMAYMVQNFCLRFQVWSCPCFCSCSWPWFFPNKDWRNFEIV